MTDTDPRMDEPRINIPEWTVSELAAALRRTVEDTYGHVRVRGEISGYRGPHSSGHAYFSLKDEGARIDAVIWKGNFQRLRFKPEEGLEVVATGRVTTYAGKSSYQIVIEQLEPAGIGALMALLEERKKKLAAEGLFDEVRKKPRFDRRMVSFQNYYLGGASECAVDKQGRSVSIGASSGTISRAESRRKRASRATATAVKPAHRPHQSPITPQPRKTPRPMATGSPTK